MQQKFSTFRKWLLSGEINGGIFVDPANLLRKNESYLSFGPRKERDTLLKSCFPATDGIVQIALSAWKFKKVRPKRNTANTGPFTAPDKGVTMAWGALSWVGMLKNLPICIAGLGNPRTNQAAALGMQTHTHVHILMYIYRVFSSFYENSVRTFMIFLILVFLTKMYKSF